MAGDWTQMDHDLPDKPEFLAIVEATGESVESVFFRLFCFWRVVDRQTLDGVLRGCGARGLASRCGGTSKFWDAVEKVTKSDECPDGWLVFKDGDTICPAFDKRFEKCAKRRIAESKRQKDEWRKNKKSKDNAETHAEKLRRKSTQGLRKNEQNCVESCKDNAETHARTETSPQRAGAPQPQPDIRNTPVAPSCFSFPETLKQFDTQEVRDAARAWIDHLYGKNKPPVNPNATILAACQSYRTPDEFCQAVWRSIRSNWASLQSPEPPKSNPDTEPEDDPRKYKSTVPKYV